MTLPKLKTPKTPSLRCPSCKDIDPHLVGYRGSDNGQMTSKAVYRCEYCSHEWLGDAEAPWVAEARRYFQSGLQRR